MLFKGNALRLRFRPENGMKVIAFGRISVFPRDGVYQLYVSELSPEGAGDLHVAFEQLKAQLEREGLFDPAHKKPLPAFPQRIAVITSSAGAAVRDIIRVLGKRWPASKVVLLPVLIVLLGLADAPKIVLIAITVFFQVLVTVRDASKSVPEQSILSMRSLGASRLDIYRHAIVPATLPELFTALRISSGTAVAILFFAEGIAGSTGLGYFIVNAWALLAYPKMFAGIIAMV